jgi:hypothetical protein
MKGFPVAKLASWLTLVTRFGIPTIKHPDDLAPEEMLLRNIDEMLALLADWPLDSATDELHRIRTKLTSGKITWGEYEHLMDSLGRRIQFELSRHMFLLVPLDKAKRMSHAEGTTGGGQMGADVLARFPDLMFDIHHAVWCLGLDLHTACVFHLSRVVEGGLREVVTTLGLTVKDRPMWNDYLVAIENHVRPPGGKKTTLTREEEIFYSGVTAHIRAIARAWRHEVVHEVATFHEESDATKIFNNIEALMQALAKGLPPRQAKS